MTDLHPEDPIVLPPDEPPDGQPEQPPVDPSDVPDPAPDASLDFFQRTTLGFNWEVAWLGDEKSPVFVDAASGDADYVNVRTVLNTGSSSVTYPADFVGPVRIQLRGESGSIEGSTNIQ